MERLFRISPKMVGSGAPEAGISVRYYYLNYFIIFADEQNLYLLFMKKEILETLKAVFPRAAINYA